MTRNRTEAAEDADEALVRRAVQGLRLRPAPASLEARVIAELRRRAALPWWRRSFRHWPWAARIAVIAACLGSVPLVGRAGAVALAAAETWLRRTGLPIALLRDVVHATVAAQSPLRLFDGALPPSWVLGGLAFAGVLYLVLLGVGAFAYRTLYLNSRTDPELP